MAAIKRIYYFPYLRLLRSSKPSQAEFRSGVLTRDGVEEHEVLEVGDLPPLPALGHVGRFEKLPRGGKGDPP